MEIIKKKQRHQVITSPLVTLYLPCPKFASELQWIPCSPSSSLVYLKLQAATLITNARSSVAS